jgi:hypothetical protein
LGGLWKRGELTDLVLVGSDGRELTAHRAILGAHSEVYCEETKKSIEIALNV